MPSPDKGLIRLAASPQNRTLLLRLNPLRKSNCRGKGVGVDTRRMLRVQRPAEDSGPKNHWRRDLRTPAPRPPHCPPHTPARSESHPPPRLPWRAPLLPRGHQPPERAPPARHQAQVEAPHTRTRLPCQRRAAPLVQSPPSCSPDGSPRQDDSLAGGSSLPLPWSGWQPRRATLLRPHTAYPGVQTSSPGAELPYLPLPPPWPPHSRPALHRPQPRPPCKISYFPPGEGPTQQRTALPSSYLAAGSPSFSRVSRTVSSANALSS